MNAKKIIASILLLTVFFSNISTINVFAEEKNDENKVVQVVENIDNDGQNYKGYILARNDVDYYKFTINATSQVQFDFLKSNKATWTTTIYDINQKEVLSFNITNYLKLEGLEDLTYSFSDIATAGNYEEEVNNTKADANSITTNKKYYGRFDRHDDIDYYKVVIPKKGELYVDFEPNGNWDIMDFGISLIGENGGWYDIAGYYGEYNSSEPLGIKAGTYYLRIADTVYTDSDKENNYNFVLKYKTNNYFEVEDNDTKETANTIKVNNKYYGASNNDEDYYKLALNDDMYVKFEFNNDKVGHVVTLSDTLGNRYIDLKTTTSKYTTSKSIKLSKGTYYLNVKALGGKYSFKIFDASDWGTHWASNEIKSAMNKNLVNTTDKFRPNNAITRAEFIKIVNKALGFKSAASSEKFTDVTSKDWWYNEVLIALKAGYITSKNSKFRPNDPITREEVASIITSIKNNKDKNLDKIKKYTDFKNVSTWAQSSVEGAIEAGYMGKGINTFRPKANITRAEAVVTLSRIK